MELERAKVRDLGQITEEIVATWEKKYEKRDDGFYCKNCDSQIKQVTCFVSIHLKAFEPKCAGPGRVSKINYPFCPKCDGELEYVRACYHVQSLIVGLPAFFLLPFPPPEKGGESGGL